MTTLTYSEIEEILKAEFNDNLFISKKEGLQSIYQIRDHNLISVCEFLCNDDRLFFDFLSCITGIDNGIQLNTMEVVYNFYSIPFNHHFCINVILPRTNPQIESVSSIWKSANWHEREIFDLLGIEFINHPDLRRILLPTDWIGNPLKKDYVVQNEYHGIKVD